MGRPGENGLRGGVSLATCATVVTGPVVCTGDEHVHMWHFDRARLEKKEKKAYACLSPPDFLHGLASAGVVLSDCTCCCLVPFVRFAQDGER